MKPSTPLASIGERLGRVLPGTGVALLLRHAERDEIPHGELGENLRLTLCGVASAERLGHLLAEWKRATVVSSPLPRCVETAEAVCRGAGWSSRVVIDGVLGDPGPFVIDPDTAGRFFLEHGILEIVRRQLHAAPPPGMRPTSDGIDLLLGLVSHQLAQASHLGVYITHDGILATLVAHLFELCHDQVPWPDYLDGLIVWRSGRRLHCTWRGLEEASYPLGG